MTTEHDTRQKVAAELYAALERLGADEELLAIVGSMSDTMNDKEILRLLEEYNRAGRVMHHLNRWSPGIHAALEAGRSSWPKLAPS
jgi:hypothetical protein